MKNSIKAHRELVGMTQAKLAEATGVGIPQVSKWENGRVDIPTSRLKQIAALFGVTADDLLRLDAAYDRIRYDAGSPEPGQLGKANAEPFRMEGASDERMREDLPVYGTALGSMRQVDGEAIEQTTLNTAEIISYARRPVLLNGNASAYGLYVSGASMEPRYMDGDILLVDPKSRIRGGDDVVIYLRTLELEEDNGEAARAVLIKRLVRRSAVAYELEQYQPARRFTVPAEDVVRVDRVIQLQELLSFEFAR